MCNNIVMKKKFLALITLFGFNCSPALAVQFKNNKSKKNLGIVFTEKIERDEDEGETEDIHSFEQAFRDKSYTVINMLFKNLHQELVDNSGSITFPVTTGSDIQDKKVNFNIINYEIESNKLIITKSDDLTTIQSGSIVMSNSNRCGEYVSYTGKYDISFNNLLKISYNEKTGRLKETRVNLTVTGKTYRQAPNGACYDGD